MKQNIFPGFVPAVFVAGMLVACGHGGDTDRTPPTSGFEPLAQAIARKEDRVAAKDLARWIIEDRRDFILVDVRSPEAFEKGHIEGARNLPIPELVSDEILQELPDGRRIILYSNGSEDAAKAEVMLRLAGFDAYLLLGGYNFWQRQILNPDIPAAAADNETPEMAEQRAISCYFAGGAQAAASPAAAKTAPPAPFTPPVSPATQETRVPEDMGLVVEEGC